MGTQPVGVILRSSEVSVSLNAGRSPADEFERNTEPDTVFYRTLQKVKSELT